ncbi:hypothetical protein D1007_57911 [Hordeum vulgare]|nr:hypothetical protein D1007_57911 [Hordeum vulgare]
MSINRRPLSLLLDALRPNWPPPASHPRRPSAPEGRHERARAPSSAPHPAPPLAAFAAGHPCPPPDLHRRRPDPPPPVVSPYSRPHRSPSAAMASRSRRP